MREAKESDLQKLCCDSQSRKALSSYRKRLSSSDDRIIFDDRVVDVLLRYSKDPEFIQEERNYLNSLVNDNGMKFCRSGKQFSELKESYEKFLGSEAPSFQWNRNYQAALARVMKRYKQFHLRPLEYRDTYDILDAISDWDTSSGFEGLFQDGSKKCDIPKETLWTTWRRMLERALEEKSFNRPILLSYRTQASGEYDENGHRTGTFKHKTRAVSMMDFWVVLSERIFAKPILTWYGSYLYSGPGFSDADLSKYILNWRYNYRRWISLDYSAYDTSIPSWLIRDAFKVIEVCFSNLANWQRDLLWVLCNDFINKNIVTPDGIIYATHGNPSGSGFTTIVNTICNEIMTETWCERYGIKNVRYNITGDDNLIFLNEKVDLDEIASYLTRNFGVRVNGDKSSAGMSVKDDPEYLSRFWTNHGPWRDKHIVLSKMMFPERWRDYREDATPEMVVYSYLLAYPSTMAELIDIEQFLIDSRLSIAKIYEVQPNFWKSLPYIFRTHLEMKLNHGKRQSRLARRLEKSA